MTAPRPAAPPLAAWRAGATITPVATTRQDSGTVPLTSTTYKTAEPPAGTLVGMLTPVNLHDALASFDQIYSPRIVARVNDYDVRIAHTRGEHVWHVHSDTDEFFLTLDGRFDVALRDPDGTERTVTLRAGDVFVVPRGTEHRPSSPGGAILMFEPTGTSTTGDHHDGAIPDHVDSTTGHELAP